MCVSNSDLLHALRPQNGGSARHDCLTASLTPAGESSQPSASRRKCPSPWGQTWRSHKPASQRGAGNVPSSPGRGPGTVRPRLRTTEESQR